MIDTGIVFIRCVQPDPYNDPSVLAMNFYHSLRRYDTDVFNLQRKSLLRSISHGLSGRSVNIF